MVSKFISITLACLFCASLVATQDNSAPSPASPIKPDELQLRPNGENNNNNNNNPLTNDNQNINNNQQVQPQTDLTTPLNNINEDPVDTGDRYPKLSDFFPPLFNPFSSDRNNRQGPPRNPLSYLFSNQLFERQMQDLSQQAEEGQQVEYLSRNGVSYVRTCTTKRV